MSKRYEVYKRPDTTTPFSSDTISSTSFQITFLSNSSTTTDDVYLIKYIDDDDCEATMDEFKVLKRAPACTCDDLRVGSSPDAIAASGGSAVVTWKFTGSCDSDNVLVTPSVPISATSWCHVTTGSTGGNKVFNISADTYPYSADVTDRSAIVTPLLGESKTPCTSGEFTVTQSAPEPPTPTVAYYLYGNFEVSCDGYNPNVQEMEQRLPYSAFTSNGTFISASTTEDTVDMGYSSIIGCYDGVDERVIRNSVTGATLEDAVPGIVQLTGSCDCSYTITYRLNYTSTSITATIVSIAGDANFDQSEMSKWVEFSPTGDDESPTCGQCDIQTASLSEIVNWKVGDVIYQCSDSSMCAYTGLTITNNIDHLSIIQEAPTPTCDCDGISLVATNPYTFDATGGTITAATVTSPCTVSDFTLEDVPSWITTGESGNDITLTAPNNEGDAKDSATINFKVNGSTTSCTSLTVSQEAKATTACTCSDFSASTNSLSFGAGADYSDVTFSKTGTCTGNLTSLTPSTNDSWITTGYTASTGVLRVSAGPNFDKCSGKTGSITVSYNGNPCNDLTITVEQSRVPCDCNAVNFSSTSTIGADGGNATFGNVATQGCGCQVSFVSSDDSWLTASVTSSGLTATATQPTQSQRTGTITVYVNGNECGTCTVTQSAPEPVAQYTFTVYSDVEGATVTWKNGGTTVSTGVITGGVCQYTTGSYNSLDVNLSKNDLPFENNDAQCSADRWVLITNANPYVTINGVEWATKNLGQNSITGIGSTYKWGATTSCPNGPAWDSGYDITTDRSNHDIAYIQTSGRYAMPTFDQISSFMGLNVIGTSLTINGVEGGIFVDNNNGNSIYMPSGKYWSTYRVPDAGDVEYLEINEGTQGGGNDSIEDCYYIRPVLVPCSCADFTVGDINGIQAAGGNVKIATYEMPCGGEVVLIRPDVVIEHVTSTSNGEIYADIKQNTTTTTRTIPVEARFIGETVDCTKVAYFTQLSICDEFTVTGKDSIYSIRGTSVLIGTYTETTVAGTYSADSSGIGWIDNVSCSDGKIWADVSKNTSTDARTASLPVTFTANDGGACTKNASITQLGSSPYTSATVICDVGDVCSDYFECVDVIITKGALPSDGPVTYEGLTGDSTHYDTEKYGVYNWIGCGQIITTDELESLLDGTADEHDFLYCYVYDDNGHLVDEDYHVYTLIPCGADQECSKFTSGADTTIAEMYNRLISGLQVFIHW